MYISKSCIVGILQNSVMKGARLVAKGKRRGEGGSPFSGEARRGEKGEALAIMALKWREKGAAFLIKKNLT